MNIRDWFKPKLTREEYLEGMGDTMEYLVLIEEVLSKNIELSNKLAKRIKKIEKKMKIK